MAANAFRLPRKKKKSIRRGLWLYPADEKGNSLMGWPHRTQEDFDAYKKGELRNLFHSASTIERKAEREMLQKPVEVNAETLQKYIDDVFHEDFRRWAFNTLRDAKANKATLAYYHEFVNACQATSEGDDSFSHTCIMAVEGAESHLSALRKRKKGKAKY